MSPISDKQVQIFQSLFKGRDEVFAIRWEKDGKSGYTPAYDFNWEEFASHKASGGTLKDFPNKQFSKLTVQRIINHISGKETIGLYPLLEDNSSWFIVADFDEALTSKKSWEDECRIFIHACTQLKLPAYLERSRSGKGGHVWIFFTSSYPAHKSRKIILHILENAGIVSPFDKNSNYDRVFPNQDYHSGKGLGNLIALPLQKTPMENNNSCFIDTKTLEPYKNQWSFLENIERVSVDCLDKIFTSINGPELLSQPFVINPLSTLHEIQVVLNNQIVIPRQQLTAAIVHFLQDNLNFVNSDYLIKKKLGKNTFGIEPYFKMIKERDGFVFLPKGFIGRLLRFLNEQKIKYTFLDERRKLATVNYSFKASLYHYQQAAVDVAEKKQMGIIVAPPGSGKTIIGLAIIANKKQPALIIVHRKQLFDQWVERIQSFLGIADAFIGKIAPGKCKIGSHITVAMMQSLPGNDGSVDIFSSFGIIIIDECHHVPAKSFRQIIQSFNAYYLYGLTATPVRKNNDEKLIFIHIGDVIHEIKQLPDKNSATRKFAIIVRETSLYIPFDYKTDKPETLYRVLIHDTERNRLIIDDISAEASAGRKVLVLTERKAHIDVLGQYLKNKYEVIAISGDDSAASKKIKLQQINDGHFQVLIATGQLLGEGADFDNLECLVLAYPFAFEGKLIQYIGRVQRSEMSPIIYDYRDIHIDYLNNQFKQRNRYYRSLMNTGQLNRYDELLLVFDGNKFFINSEDCILSITCLDLSLEIEQFKEGTVWKIRVLSYNEDNCELKAEIVNYHASAEIAKGRQQSLQFLMIDKISFRATDTIQMLQSVVLKRNHDLALQVSEPAIEFNITEQPDAPLSTPIEPPINRTLKKNIKVPFKELKFQHAGVAFSFFIDELQKEISFEIYNPDIRPEFEAIKEYFTKILKKKSASIEINIRFTGKEIVDATAVSEDIDTINSSIIDSVRFEFVKKGMLTFRGNPQNNTVLHTIDSLSGFEKGIAEKVFKSEQDLIGDILQIKDSKHYLHLKCLSSLHLSSILKIRFILNPFSFLFLLSGDTKYHLVWETLNSEEATYIWHFEKSMDALRKGLNEIEATLKEIKANSKQEYLRQDHDHFSRVMHDYSDVKTGFSTWKGMLEEKLV